MTCAASAQAETVVTTWLSTGNDDLRHGNRAFLRLMRMDGSLTSEQVVSTGLGGGSHVAAIARFPETIDAAQIRGFVLRHDGNPRSGHPFDTYDNWNLRRLVLRHDGLTLYDSENDSRSVGFVQRFTGSVRHLTKFMISAPGEPDFRITRIGSSTVGTFVTVRNDGDAGGRITSFACSVTGRHASTSLERELSAGATTTIVLRALPSPRGTTTCKVDGVDRAGRPEMVTANNVARRRF